MTIKPREGMQIKPALMQSCELCYKALGMQQHNGHVVVLHLCMRQQFSQVDTEDSMRRPEPKGVEMDNSYKRAGLR